MSTCEEDHVIPVKDFRYDLFVGGRGVWGEDHLIAHRLHTLLSCLGLGFSVPIIFRRMTWWIEQA